MPANFYRGVPNIFIYIYRLHCALVLSLLWLSAKKWKVKRCSLGCITLRGGIACPEVRLVLIRSWFFIGAHFKQIYRFIQHITVRLCQCKDHIGATMMSQITGKLFWWSIHILNKTSLGSCDGQFHYFLTSSHDMMKRLIGKRLTENETNDWFHVCQLYVRFYLFCVSVSARQQQSVTSARFGALLSYVGSV